MKQLPPVPRAVNFDTSHNVEIPSPALSSSPLSTTPVSSSPVPVPIPLPTGSSFMTTTTNNTNGAAGSSTTTKTTTITFSSTSQAGTASATQQDRMAKLSFLKELHDQGYITVTEYKERKQQIIDDLTGTRTRTRTRTNSQTSQNLPSSPIMHGPSSASAPARAPLHAPTVIASPPPDWSSFKEESAIRHVYDTTKNQWTATAVKVKLDAEPFATGGLRKCYHIQDLTMPDEKFVAKLSIDPYEENSIYYIDVEIQMRSKEFARQFNEYKPPKQVDFVMAWLLELTEREGKPICGVEKFIDGPYRKHNNNFGFVSDAERSTPQAFSHFTYEASGHQLIIVDIQGVADLYTDPQIHTTDKNAQLMGKGNMGARGIQKFLATHQCNAICRYLKLPSVNAKRDDIGTVPAQPRMSYQKVEIVDIVGYAAPPLISIPSDQIPLVDNSMHSINTHPDRCCCVIL